MSTENTDVAEVIQPEVVEPEKVVAETPQEKPQETDKDHNFRQMRETLQQRDEEIKSLRALQEKPKEDVLQNDDLVEGKHLKQGLSEIKDLIRRKELETIPGKLQAKFKDFNSVVTKENIEKVKKIEPELFQTLQVNSSRYMDPDDLMVKGIAAYKTIRSLGICETGEQRNKKNQIQSNQSKPMSAQSISSSGAIHEANSYAGGLTQDRKDQLYKEMVEAAKAC